MWVSTGRPWKGAVLNTVLPVRKHSHIMLHRFWRSDPPPPPPPVSLSRVAGLHEASPPSSLSHFWRFLHPPYRYPIPGCNVICECSLTDSHDIEMEDTSAMWFSIITTITYMYDDTIACNWSSRMPEWTGHALPLWIALECADFHPEIAKPN